MRAASAFRRSFGGPARSSRGTVENGLISGLDWFPALAAAAGAPDIKDQLLKGVKLGDRTYKNHLDGYNQLDLLTGKEPSVRHELFYFGGPTLGALRLAASMLSTGRRRAPVRQWTGTLWQRQMAHLKA